MFIEALTTELLSTLGHHHIQILHLLKLALHHLLGQVLGEGQVALLGAAQVLPHSTMLLNLQHQGRVNGLGFRH